MCGFAWVCIRSRIVRLVGGGQDNSAPCTQRQAPSPFRATRRWATSHTLPTALPSSCCCHDTVQHVRVQWRAGYQRSSVQGMRMLPCCPSSSSCVRRFMPHDLAVRPLAAPRPFIHPSSSCVRQQTAEAVPCSQSPALQPQAIHAASSVIVPRPQSDAPVSTSGSREGPLHNPFGRTACSRRPSMCRSGRRSGRTSQLNRRLARQTHTGSHPSSPS